MAATVTRWWWIRHAPVRDQAGRIHGRTDHPADCSDRASIAALGAGLPADAAWVTSSRRRAQETARALAAAIAGPPASAPLVEPALDEQDFGAWEGRTFHCQHVLTS